MTYEEFISLDEEQRRAAFVSAEMLRDAEAQRDSYKTENDELRKRADAAEDELKKTKALNFTLARKINVETRKRQAEEVLNEMFGGKK